MKQPQAEGVKRINRTKVFAITRTLEAGEEHARSERLTIIDCSFTCVHFFTTDHRHA